MANDKNFQVTPTLKNGKVDWEMCVVDNGQKKDCGSSNGTYPDVWLSTNTGAYNFKVEIVGDNTGLGIKFANNDGLVVKAGEPTGPNQKQIHSQAGNGSGKLTFVDNNSLPNKDFPNPVVIDYGLNFTDKDGNPVTSIDPDITNGGTNRFSFADYLLPVAIGLAAGILLTVLYRSFVLRRAW